MARRLWLVIGGVFAWTLAPVAVAQTGAGVGYSRPSDRGPSSQLGRVGGRYTTGDVAGPAAPVQVVGPSRALGLPSRTQWGARYAPAAMRLGPLPSTYRGSLLPTAGTISGWQIQSASGYQRAISVETPLYGWGGMNMLRVTTTPLRVPLPEGSPFHRALGLKPTKDQPPAEEPVVFDEVWKTVQRGTDRRVNGRMDEALSLLRELTAKPMDPKEYLKKADEAFRLFRYVRKLDKTDSLSCLLGAHLALEREQYRSAVNDLVAAAMREPETFRDGPELASYFGDYDEQTGRSARFESQMRALLQAVIQGHGPDFSVLEAYCALELGDTRRAGEALDRAEEQLKQGTAAAPELSALVNALRYAL